MSKIVLLSILPEWADAILDGKKKWEFRRIAPRIDLGDRVILYASNKFSRIVGEFFVGEIIHDSIEPLIRRTLKDTPHKKEDLYSYFKGKEKGYAIEVKDPTRYNEPISLHTIKKWHPSFVPPQSFQYLRINDSRTRYIVEALPERTSCYGQRNLTNFPM